MSKASDKILQRKKMRSMQTAKETGAGTPVDTVAPAAKEPEYHPPEESPSASESALSPEEPSLGNISASDPVEKEINPLDTRYVSAKAPCGAESKGYSITTENLRFIKIRSSQLGMAMQNYIGLILEEEKIRMQDKVVDPYTIEVQERHGTKMKSLTLSKEVIAFIDQSSAMHGMTKSEYMDYVITKERDREKEYGLRTADDR